MPEAPVSFTPDYLERLTRRFSGFLLSAAGRPVQRKIREAEAEASFRRCAEAGIWAAARELTRDAGAEREATLAKILSAFLADERTGPIVAEELAEILNGRPPDIRELTRRLVQVADKPEAPSDLPLAEAVAAFEAAFLAAVLREAPLLPILRPDQLMNRPGLQRELIDSLNQLVIMLRDENLRVSGIRAGTIYAKNVVNGNQHIFGDETESAATAKRLRTRYLRDLAAETARLPWGRFAPEKGETAGGRERLRLTDVFVPLDALAVDETGGEAELRRTLARSGETDRIPAQEAVNRWDRLVLLGDPGSGKTILVNFLTHHLARAEDPASPSSLSPLEEAGPWSHGPLFPVRVLLREFGAWMEKAADAEPTADALTAFLRERLSRLGLEPLWAELHAEIQSEETPVFFLLDGLDEVGAERRSKVVRIVADFADRYPHNRFLATCRVYAYAEADHRLSGFRTAALTPFNRTQVKAFIGAWFAELTRRSPLRRDDLADRAERLKAAVKSGALRDLARRPLLLTVMALLHTAYGRLPEDRVELYQWAVDLLLQRWKGDAGGVTGFMEALGLGHLPKSSLEAGIFRVAFDAHGGGGGTGGIAEMDEGALLVRLRPYLGGDVKAAESFIRFIRERTGLLIRHKPNAFTFPHRTFQEFLAARHLVGRRDFPAEAADLVIRDMDRWRMVFVLAAGHARRTHQLGGAVSAVSKLLPKEPDSDDRPNRKAFLLAEIAAEAVLEIGPSEMNRDREGPGVLDRVRRWLLAALTADLLLSPRERADAGIRLAAVGDPRFSPDFLFLPAGDDLGFRRIPAGPFSMGEGDDEHPETLPEFFIGRFPVTVHQYGRFRMDAGQNGPERAARSRKGGNQPAVRVSWYEAMVYCQWLERRLRESPDRVPEAILQTLNEGGQVRLPTEAEWERAARGTDDRVFPWGDGPDPNRANYEDSGIGAPSPVGAFPGGESPEGCLDMAGNVAEWTASRFYPDPNGGPDSKKPEAVHVNVGEKEAETARVVRGGAFTDSDYFIRCAHRDGFLPDLRSRGHGFRVCIGPSLEETDS
jgi:formylglycine-generating enzyme required for sulfatase activity